MNSEISQEFWMKEEGKGPLVAVALHAGHEMCNELLDLSAMGESRRVREEDPYTYYWAKTFPTWVVAKRSRFEADLNRPRDDAIYLAPEQAWGMDLWTEKPPPDAVDKALQGYDAFYKEIGCILDRKAREHRRFVVLDLHSYNHRRNGPHAPPGDLETHPEVNIGTGSMDRNLFGNLVDHFMNELRCFDFFGRHLDVRENIKFRGRHLAAWAHNRYPGAACVIAIEFKKIYMDEWTGIADIDQVTTIRDALQSTVPGILKELKRLEIQKS